jgi:leader peptidase (prepilin peptidase)/N-methyltransferase
MVGLLFGWWVVMGFWFFRLVNTPLLVIQPMFWLMTGIILAILALSDLFYGVVIMPFVWIGSVVVIGYRLLLTHYGAYHLVDLGNAILVGAAFFSFFWSLNKITKGRGMADGDMYVAMYLGLLLGWPKGLVAMFVSFVVGALVGVVLIATKLRTRKDVLPFVPFMITGTLIALIYGTQIWQFVYPI